jgi:trimeric autotransporter adhesin
VAYTPVAPLTTVRYLSTQAVDGTWTSVASPEMATNFCRGAVRLTAGGISTGFAGDGGAATSASLNTPYQPVEAPDGRIFVADSANNRIRVISTAGVITTFAGGPAASACTYTGPVSGLGLNAPRGVAVDSAGNVYIADTGANCIRKVDTAGTVTRVAGGGGTTTCTATTTTAVSLLTPSGLAIDGTGALIVADSGRNCIRKIVGTTVSAVAGGGGTTTCTATTATGVSLSGPVGVAVDSADNVYIADTGRNCLRKVVGTTVSAVAGGGGTTTCGTTTSTAVALSGPQGVEVDAAGNVYVADAARRCVRKVTGTAVTLVAFTGGNSSSGDNGPALAATMRTPAMLALMADGDLLVTDRATNTGSSEIRRIELS